jgi:hypothetical protein
METIHVTACSGSGQRKGLEGALSPGAVGPAPGLAVSHFLNVKKVREALSVMLTLPLVVSVTVVV